MKRVKLIVLAVLVAITGIFSTLQESTASAAETGASSSALSIAPKKNYLIESGKSVNDTLLIRNLDTANDLTLTMQVIDFSYTGDDGTPKLMLDENAPQTTWSLRSYMTVPQSVTIPAGDTKQVPVSVAIPANVGAGSYYSAILYSTGAPNGGNVGLAASGVTLVFVSVPGQVNEKLTLQKLGTYHAAIGTTTPAGFGGYISTAMPQQIGYTLKNEGNVTESPVGSIKLHYMFGQDTMINDINPVGSLALIGQTRTFTACIKLKDSSDSNQQNTCVDPGLLPGMYTITFDAFYGQNGNNTEEIIHNATFWYLPWWFVVAFLVVLIIVTFFIWRVVVRIQNAFGGGPRRKKRGTPFRRR